MTLPTDIPTLATDQIAQNTSEIADSNVSLTPRFNAGLPAQPTEVQTASAVLTEPLSTGAKQQHHRRWGRIARLPSDVRVAINQSLRDGKSYDEILQDLFLAGHTQITYDNLATWFKTGYADWLRDQEHFEKLVLTTDAARLEKAPRKNRKSFRDLSELELAVLLNNAAREFNLEKIREQIDTKPDSFFRLVHAHALHERNAILRDRNAIELKKISKKKKPEKPAQPKRGGVTAEELERIERRINL